MKNQKTAPACKYGKKTHIYIYIYIRLKIKPNSVRIRF
jgi:hypothetical protein